MPNVRDEIGDLWRKINRQTHDRMRQAFKGSELPLTSLYLLRNILKEPGVTVGELARKTGMVKSHISNTAEQLVRQGLIEKRSDPSDQRLIRLFPTLSANQMRVHMEARAEEAWAGVVAEVPEGQLDDVVLGLRVLLQALEKSNTKHEEPQT